METEQGLAPFREGAAATTDNNDRRLALWKIGPRRTLLLTNLDCRDDWEVRSRSGSGISCPWQKVAGAPVGAMRNTMSLA